MKYGRRRPLRLRSINTIGEPKFSVGDRIGGFQIIHYMGHSDINKRNTHIMAKPQHWYRCRCTCGVEESRSQQELIDTRRQQKCYVCRSTTTTERRLNEDTSG